MSKADALNLPEGAIVALPFLENEKFVVGSMRGGGMGNVYQLIPLLPGASPLALKTYQGEGDYAQFEREARIWVSLASHPNIAKAITYGMLNDVRCILAYWYPRNALDLNSRSLSSEEILRPGAYSEIFFLTEMGSGIGRLIVDPFKRLLFSTKPEDVQALKQLRRQGLSLGDAIQQLQDSRKAKEREVNYGR